MTLFLEAEAEEIQAVEAEETLEAIQEEEETQQANRTPQTYPLSRWPTSEQWEHHPASSTEIEPKQETS